MAFLGQNMWCVVHKYCFTINFSGIWQCSLNWYL